MSEFDEFFNGGGEYAASGKFTTKSGPGQATEVGGSIVGTIVSLTTVDMTKYGSDESVIDDKTGKPVQQIRIVLDTEYRNWDKAAKVPTDDDGNPQPGSEDTGRRAIYAKVPHGWMVSAIGEAVLKATGKSGAPAVGGKLGVKVTELVPTVYGNPYPKYAAHYEAPSPLDDAFGTPAAPTPAAPVADEPPF